MIQPGSLGAGTLKQQPANVFAASACAQAHWHTYSSDIQAPAKQSAIDQE